MQKWEYLVRRCKHKGKSGWLLETGDEYRLLNDELDYLGGLGWELVGIQLLDAGYGNNPSNYVFKRPIEE